MPPPVAPVAKASVPRTIPERARLGRSNVHEAGDHRIAGDVHFMELAAPETGALRR